MSLYQKYRPKSLDEIMGNEDTVSALRGILQKEEKPHAFLFYGPTGCGKTTLGRIIAKELGCEGNDYREIDSADFRGIDTVREIRKQAHYKPIESKVRVWLIDECFAKGTEVTLANGERIPIEQAHVGYEVRNMYGKAKVKEVFHNRIPLSRVVRISFTDREVFCSKDHLFMTNSGWKEAANLSKEDLVLSYYNMGKDTEKQTQSKISDRSRWKGTSFERDEVIRQEKRGQITFARVESVEIYQPGNNDQSFRSIIGDEERDQGFVTFYDLEIDGHPSYIANGMLVHNCHKMTNDAQNALLKILEDPPKHVYFILATTEPQKLIPTIKGRCVQYAVSPLSDIQMKKLLRNIVKAENASLDKIIYDQIVQDSFSYPRNAIQILEQVLAAPPEKRLEVAKRSAERQSQTIELCRALVSGEGWKKIALILSGLKEEEPESIRRAVLGYCSTAILKSSGLSAVTIAKIMEQMIDPFYDSGFPGLVFACYVISEGEKYQLD